MTPGEKCPACGSTDTIRVGGNEYGCPRWRCEPCCGAFVKLGWGINAPDDVTFSAVIEFPSDGCTVFVP